MTATRNLVSAMCIPMAILGMPALAQAPANALPTLGSPSGEARFAERVLDPDASFDARHAACLRTIASDAELAYETAMVWQSRGGGFRADHCAAMALFTLGHEGEAARRLETLSEQFPDTDADMRRRKVGFLSEAAQSWLQAGEPNKAWDAASAVLELEPSDALARITRARVYFTRDRFADAETDLTSTLVFHPDHAEALRYRADARLKLGKLDAALEDAEASLAIAPDVDTALIRGHIRQAMAKASASP